MKNLKDLIRPNIYALAPYSCARNEFKGLNATAYLDANENPYNSAVNRYPDPLQLEVKAMLAPIKGVKESEIFLGNGRTITVDQTLAGYHGTVVGGLLETIEGELADAIGDELVTDTGDGIEIYCIWEV